MSGMDAVVTDRIKHRANSGEYQAPSRPRVSKGHRVETPASSAHRIDHRVSRQ